MEWIVDNEDVLLQVRSSYSKRAGTLFVTSKRVAWYQSTARAPQISLPLTLLKLGGHIFFIGFSFVLLLQGIQREARAYFEPFDLFCSFLFCFSS